jgi:hypothetical protein
LASIRERLQRQAETASAGSWSGFECKHVGSQLSSYLVLNYFRGVSTLNGIMLLNFPYSHGVMSYSFQDSVVIE